MNPYLCAQNPKVEEEFVAAKEEKDLRNTLSGLLEDGLGILHEPQVALTHNVAWMYLVQKGEALREEAQNPASNPHELFQRIRTWWERVKAWLRQRGLPQRSPTSS